MTAHPPVVVALSGGVDSATAAALMVAEGHQVIGITMRLYDATGTTAASGRCCGPRDIEDARRVCSHLDIPFYVVDLEEDFSRSVVDDFVDAYLRGDTPNPCVRCNQHIKFTPLLERARALGASEVVTGHYARLVRGPDGTALHRGVDSKKDQSYFLFSMPREELGAVRFPLGELSKDEVREQARAHSLPNADKKESQEICFVPDGDYSGFVERAAERRGLSIPVAGDIVDEEGQVLGRHQGIHRYTVGQRRGLGNINLGGRPAYVVRIDPDTRRVVVGDRPATRTQTVRVGDVRWLVDSDDTGEFDVQVRYRAPVVRATVQSRLPGEVVLAVDSDVVAAPGQAAVFYRDDQVLGGGWIRR